MGSVSIETYRREEDSSYGFGISFIADHSIFRSRPAKLRSDLYRQSIFGRIWLNRGIFIHCARRSTASCSTIKRTGSPPFHTRRGGCILSNTALQGNQPVHHSGQLRGCLRRCFRKPALKPAPNHSVFQGQLSNRRLSCSVYDRPSQGNGIDE